MKKVGQASKPHKYWICEHLNITKSAKKAGKTVKKWVSLQASPSNKTQNAGKCRKFNVFEWLRKNRLTHFCG